MDRTGDPGSVRIAAIVLVGGQVLAAVGAVAVNLLAARTLEPAPRGDLAYALQMAYFFSVFAVMGLERPFMAARTGSFNSEYRVFTRMILPGTLVSIPFVILVTAFSPFSTNWMILGALSIAVYVALNSLVAGVRVAYVSSRDWRKFAINAFGSQIIIVVGAITLVLLNISDPVIWMMAYSLSAIPALILLWLAARNGQKAQFPTIPERRILRRKGWILLPATFSNTAMQRSDRLLLPIFSTPADLGLYVTVATVLEMATWPVERWVDASLRRWSQSESLVFSGIGRLLVKSLLLLIAMASLLGCAAYLMIWTFLPEPYMAATIAIVPLAIASVIYGLTRVQQGVLIAFGAEGKVAGVEIFGTIAAIAAYVILIPPYGMLGAAYGSILGYSACAIASTVAVASLKKK